MSSDPTPDTAGSRTFLQRGSVLLLLLCSAVVIFFVVLTQMRSPAVTLPQAIPLPFGSADSSLLKGLLTDLGTTSDNRRIIDMTFDQDEISHEFSVNDLIFVLTPALPASFSSNAPLSVVFTPNKRFYGYRYSSRDAAIEIARQLEKKNDQTAKVYLYSYLFPGTFFASPSELADQEFVDGFAAKGITFGRLADVRLDADSRYLIIAEEAGVSIAVRGLLWCGDGDLLPDGVDQTQGTADDEQCDDANPTADDGCTSCQIDSGYACSGVPSVCTPGSTVSFMRHELQIAGR